MDDVSTQQLRDKLGKVLSPRCEGLLTHERVIRAAMLDVIHRLTERGWASFVVGGAVRDLVLGPAERLPRDVDIVVCAGSLDELAKLYSDLITSRTSFGGLRLRRRVDLRGSFDFVYDLVFDVWPLEETWAIKEFGLPPTISSLTATTFLNLDAIAAETHTTRGRARAVYEHGFFEGVNRQEVEINFPQNPFPAVCIARSLIMAAKLQFSIGRKLAEFICDKFYTLGVGALLAAQMSHYGCVRCSAREMMAWVTAIELQLRTGRSKIELPVSRARQEGLWSDWQSAAPSQLAPNGASC